MVKLSTQIWKYADPDIPDSVRKANIMRVRQAGNILEVKRYLTITDEMPFERFDESTYLVKSSGELKQYQETENRADNLGSLAKSMSDARAIINANFCGGQNEAWLNLTYAENMTDTKRLYDDFRKFIARLRRRAACNLEYMIIVEPQGRGAWHIHGLIRAPDGMKFYIPQEELLGIWSHGSVYVKRLRGIDNVGAYITAYCSNMPSNDPNSKTYKKHQRLRLYPTGMRFYRCSRGMIRPEWVKPERRQKKISELLTPRYSQVTTIKDDDGNVIQYIVYAQYNLTSSNKQAAEGNGSKLEAATSRNFEE